MALHVHHGMTPMGEGTVRPYISLNRVHLSHGLTSGFLAAQSVTAAQAARLCAQAGLVTECSGVLDRKISTRSRADFARRHAERGDA